MAEGFLEYEIRRLPDVVAAAVDDASVTVLVQPDADADAIHAVLAAMVADASPERAITVLGGTSSADLRSRRFAPLVGGGIVGAGLLASAAAAAALTGGLPLLPGVEQPPEPPPVAPAAAAPAPAPAPRDVPGRLIVPGPRPEWASSQPWLELPLADVEVPLAIAAAPVTVAAEPARPSRPARSKLPAVAPPPLEPAAAPEPAVLPPPPPPVVEETPPAVVVVPDLDVPVTTVVVDGPDRPPRPATPVDDEPEVVKPEVVKPEVIKPEVDEPGVGGSDSDGDRHRNDRGRGHHSHGNGRGRGHQVAAGDES